MLRVTDGNTRPGAPGRSYTTPSAAHQTAWNANSTYFYVRSVDGYFIPYAFNAATMSASRLQATSSGDGGLVIASQTEPQFSFASPNVLYVTRQDSGNDWPIIATFDFSTGAYTDLLNLGEAAPIARHTYTGGLSSSAGSSERVMAFFGGAAQDSHYLVAVFAPGQPRSVALLDTTTSTVTVDDTRTPTNIPLNFHLHHAWLDKSGRYVILETTAPDRPARAPLYVWDTIANTFTALPESSALAGGHFATGFGTMVNQDCCTSTTWDSAQWQFRRLATPTANQDLIAPVLSPQETYAGDHASWNNAQPGTLVPFITGFYRTATETAPWRPWDDEIIAVQTGGDVERHRVAVCSSPFKPRVLLGHTARERLAGRPLGPLYVQLGKNAWRRSGRRTARRRFPGRTARRRSFAAFPDASSSARSGARQRRHHPRHRHQRPLRLQRRRRGRPLPRQRRAPSARNRFSGRRSSTRPRTATA